MKPDSEDDFEPDATHTLPAPASSMMRLAPFVVAILTLLLTGCIENNTDILAAVKRGTLPTTTKPIGKAFDDAFPGGNWTASLSGMGMGEMVAQFRATSTAEALESSGVPPIDRKNCIDGVTSPCHIPVSFQFTLAPDTVSVSLALVEAPEPMKSGEQLKALLNFVYR